MRTLVFLLFMRLTRFLTGKGLGRIPGAITLYSLVRDQLKPKAVILINVQGNKMYVNTDDKGIVPLLLRDGEMEKYDTELFKKMVKEGMVVVDVGANIGYYTLIAAKLVRKEGIVYAFEPEPSNYELLCKNIEVNGYTNVVPVQKAVSSKHGKTKLWCDKVNFASPSFSRENVLSFSNDAVLEKHNFVEVETVTLDEFFENTVKNTKVDFMKIDAEGAEGLIVDGAEKILKNNDLKIIMEFWPDALRNVGTDPLQALYKLQKYGFKIEFINERKQALEPLEEVIESCAKPRLSDGFNLLLRK